MQPGKGAGNFQMAEFFASNRYRSCKLI
jgi:hypothetical protein